jgi:lipopolysaccharide biosynthesis glycosyltransferase
MPQDNEMEVLCACDQPYLPHAATMLCSLLEHNSISRIHLIYSSIASRELAKLESLVARYRTAIAFYEVVPTDFHDLRVDGHATVAVYYRLLAPRLLPADINKILYLDSDIIVRRSLNDLWDTDLTDRALAAVPDYDPWAPSTIWATCCEDAKGLGFPVGAKYFNSGVLLINLQFWRQNNVPERAIAFIRNNPQKVQYWDQDALNAILVNQWIELPGCWNAQSEADWMPTFMGTKPDPAIVHFSTGKPWYWSNTHPFKHEYGKYRFKTPWWLYREEVRPRLPRRISRFLRNCVRDVMPRSLRRRLRSRVMNSRTLNVLFHRF